MIDRLPFLLVVTAALLGSLLFGAIKYASGGVTKTTSNQQAVEPPEPEIIPFEVTPIDEMKETRDRPLFFANRREPKAADPAPIETGIKDPEIDAGPNEFRLSAVVIDDGAHTALLMDPTGAVHRVAEGGKIGAWVLKSVTAESVTLVNGGRAQEVQLRTFEPPLPAVPANPKGKRRAPQRAVADPDDAATKRGGTKTAARTSEALRERMRQRQERRARRQKRATEQRSDDANEDRGRAAQPLSKPKTGGDCGLSRC